MDIIRQQIIEKSREYLGTPFKHQGRLKGVGIDCAGLIICVAKELGLTEFDHKAYGHLPHSGMMQSHCNEQMRMIQIQDAKPGDIYLMAFDQQPQHLCIITDIGIIHAYAQVRKCVEHSFDEIWRLRVRRAYTYWGVE